MREDSLIEKVTEKDSEAQTKKEIDQPVLEKSTQVTQEREHQVLSGELKSKYDSLIENHGTAASDTLDALSYEHKHKLLAILDADSLGHAIQDGPEAVQTLAGWSEKELREHGPELAVRAKRDAVALGAVKELVESGPIDPKNLTEHQRALIEKIAEYSTQNGDQKQGVLGKWTDLSSGFVKYAQDTDSLHYNPHRDMWKMLGALGENRSEVAWLINRQVIQTGVSKGLVFEYSLNGILDDAMQNEDAAITSIFSGKTQAEVKNIVQKDSLPIRMRELQELQQAGYELAFDEVRNSYVLTPMEKGKTQ